MIAECTSRREDAAIVVDLEAGLSAAEADRRVARAHRAGDIGARALAFYLVDIADRGVHQEFGFHGVEQYAEMRYHIRPPTTRSYLATGRALDELPEIDEAFCRGKLFWSQVRELARVATAETEAEWLDWARGRSAREIATHAGVRRKGERPADRARRRIRNATFQASARLNALQWAKWGTAREKFEAELGRPITDGEMMEQAADLLLSTRPDGSVPGRIAVNDSHYTIVTIQDPTTGAMAVEIDGELVSFGDQEFDNSGPEVPQEERDIETPPALRRLVLARDGFRCLCCGSRKNLTTHHLHWRSHGGRTVEENLGTLCDDCHGLVHDRCLVFRGTVPGNLRFFDAHGRELGELGEPVRQLIESMLVARKAAQQDTRVSSETEVPPRADSSLPATLDDFVGQRPAVANLRRAALRARRRGYPMPHILLCGPPGLGKSSLGSAVAAEAGVGLHQVSAPLISGTADLFRRLAALRDRDVLFVDEIHRLAPGLAEALYESMESPLFTLIGATTDEDLLPAALISRFAIRQDLAFYSYDELSEILRRGAARFGLAIEEPAVGVIARASRDTPREALRLLAAVRDETELRGMASADCATVSEVLRSLEIDEAGLGRIDRAYLVALREAPRPLSLGTLADRLGKSPAALLRVTEPFLIRCGLIARTIHGRVLLECPQVV